MAFVERRVFRQLHFSVDVQYKAVSSPEKLKAYRTYSKNIRVGGISLVILEKLDPGCLLDLKFLLPDSMEPILASGKVVWIEGHAIAATSADKAYNVGIQFIWISQKDKDKIDQYVFSKR